MKLKSIRSIPIVFAVLALLALSACTGEKRADTTERAGSPQTPPKNLDALTSYQFDRRDEFRSQFNAMYSEFSAQLREYEAKNAGVAPSDSAKAALADVKAAETEFKNKLEALSTATAENWEAARRDVTAAWEKLQAAFGRVHASNVIPNQGL
jgi:hypothetical protein